MGFLNRTDTIRTRILIGFLFAGLLPLCGVFFVYETLSRRSIERAEFNKMDELAGEAARQISVNMERAETDLQSVESNPLFLREDASIASKLKEMKRLVRIYQFFSDLTLYDQRGFFLGSTNPDHPGHRERTTWFKEAVESGRWSVSTPVRMMEEDDLSVTVYMPLGSSREVVEVMTARVRFVEISSLLDGIRVGKRGEMVLLDQFGNVLAYHDKSRIFSRFDDNVALASWHEHPRGYYNFDGEMCLYTVHILGPGETRVDSAWTLICFEPWREVEAIVAGNRADQLWGAAGGMLLVFLVGLFASRQLSRPLERAADTADAVCSGDLSQRMLAEGAKEMKRLASSFNQMLDDILEYREDLESKVACRTERLRKAQEALRAERESLAERVALRTRELHAANKELARNARMKDEFLAGMSHELRTPLNAVLGLTESLEEGTYGPLTQKQIDTLQIIDESGRHLLALINDILDVAKIDAGEMQLDIATVDVVKVCRSSLKLVQQAALKKNLDLRLKVDPKVSVLACDERRLKQILVNLLSNAVKFTPAGMVGLEVNADATERRVEFVVWDTGIGIPENQQEKLFQPFVQLDSSLERQYEGTGLGLALVFNLTEIHGGCVSATSVINSGTRVTVALPWYEDTGPERPLREHLECEGESRGVVLVVDDHERELMRVASELNDVGYEVFAARDGAKAVDLARHLKPDAILLDAQLSGMDGLEATHHLRSEPSLARTPIVGLTSLNIPGDIRRIHEAGMTDCLLKPVRIRALLALLDFHRSKQQPRKRDQLALSWPEYV